VVTADETLPSGFIESALESIGDPTECRETDVELAYESRCARFDGKKKTSKHA